MGTDRRRFLARLGQGGVAAALFPMLDVDALAAAPPALPTGDDQDEAYWQAVRAQFPIRAGLAPMNAANLCPAPSSVIEATAAAATSVDGDVSFQNRAQYDTLREELRARLAA